MYTRLIDKYTSRIKSWLCRWIIGVFHHLHDFFPANIVTIGLLIDGYGYGVLRHFQHYCSYIVEVSFIGEGNRR